MLTARDVQVRYLNGGWRAHRVGERGWSEAAHASRAEAWDAGKSLAEADGVTLWLLDESGLAVGGISFRDEPVRC